MGFQTVGLLQTIVDRYAHVGSKLANHGYLKKVRAPAPSPLDLAEIIDHNQVDPTKYPFSIPQCARYLARKPQFSCQHPFFKITAFNERHTLVR